MNDQAPTSIDQYILMFAPEIRERLEAIRAIIREEAPEAKEKIGYGMPTFTLNGNLIHFAAFKHHIGIYPTPSGIEAFKDELSAYKNSKGAVQFPYNEPIPFDLIKKIVRFRAEENRSKK